MSRDKQQRKSYQSYEMKMSPAARRRQRNGKRSGEEYHTTNISLDMTDQELLEIWDDYDDNGWTESIRKQVQYQEVGYDFEEIEQRPRRKSNTRNNRSNREPERANQSARNSSARNSSARNSSARNESKRNASKRAELRTEDTYKNPSEGKESRRGRVPGNKKNVLGIFLSNIEIIATLIFIGSVLLLNVLPFIYVAVIVVVLIGIAVMIRLTQITRKKGRFIGKVASVFLTVMMVLGTYYCLLSFVLLGNIAGENDIDLALNKETYTVYISGIDVFGDLEQESRSDVNLLATVNPKTGEVLLTTTPRDYYVEIPGVSNGEKDKLTHAGNYGIDVSMDTLEALYDQPIDFFVRVNFTSFINIIDAIGGVTVHSDIAFSVSPWDGNNFDVQVGANELTGTQALAFCRERYNLVDGDMQRGKNQQAMIKGIISKMILPTSILHIDDILTCIEGDVDTNLTRAQLQQFSKGILQNIIGLNMYSIAAEGTTSREWCYSYTSKSLSVTVPNQESVNQIQTYMNDVEAGEALPTE